MREVADVVQGTTDKVTEGKGMKGKLQLKTCQTTGKKACWILCRLQLEKGCKRGRGLREGGACKGVNKLLEQRMKIVEMVFERRIATGILNT